MGQMCVAKCVLNDSPRVRCKVVPFRDTLFHVRWGAVAVFKINFVQQRDLLSRERINRRSRMYGARTGKIAFSVEMMTFLVPSPLCYIQGLVSNYATPLIYFV